MNKNCESLSETFGYNIENLFKSKTYNLLNKIGEGGFGQVYKALNLRTQQYVAIKIVLLKHGASTDKNRRQIARFNREAELCSKLRHPNIVALLDRGQSRNLIFAVFEYIEGRTLKDELLCLNKLAPPRAAEVMLQVLDALVHAHGMGVVHRDLKPANIMLTNTGAKTHAKILDFGISALAVEMRQHDYQNITLTQETLGTPAYCAPEQLRGEPPSSKSDLYVWALVFIECLTGVPTVGGSCLAAIFHKQLCAAEIPLPSALAGHPVAPLLRQILIKNLVERSGNTLEFYHAFIKLDFSTLVGVIHHPNQALPKQAFLSSGGQPTRVDSHFLKHNFTECKQITALCVTLSMVCCEADTDKYQEPDCTQATRKEYQQYCINLALRYSALHVGTLGDTLLFYFGYPLVSDHDARWCALTALEFIHFLNKQNSLSQHNESVCCYAHVGIHCGLVTVNSGMLPEGDTPNEAMNLARMASKNQILCSESSHNILRSNFKFGTRSAADIPNSQFAHTHYALTGIRARQSAITQDPNRNSRHFVGRGAELHSIMAILADDNRVRHVHLYGETGIGKSRLLFELQHYTQLYHPIVVRCLPEQQNYALKPILELLKIRLGIHTVSEAKAVELLRSLLSMQTSFQSDTVLSLLCSHLDYQWQTVPDQISINVSQSPKHLFESLIYLLCQVKTKAAHKNYLYIVEDLQWADQSTLEFLQTFCASSDFKLSQSRLITTTRQLPDTWHYTSHQMTIEIKRFTTEQSTKFISQLFEQQSIAAELVALIIEKTDGIPLYMVKLIDMIKHQKHVALINGKLQLTTHPNKLNVPDGLRDTLQQKLDGLISAKKITQLASAIGREFDLETLKLSSGQDENQLRLLLDELIQAELIYVQQREDGQRFVFKNAMYRDAAYNSMPRAIKREVHKLLEAQGRHCNNLSINSIAQSKNAAWLTTSDPNKLAKNDKSLF